MHYRAFVPSDFPRLLELSMQFDTSPFSFDPEFRSLSNSYEPFFAREMLRKKGTTTLVAESENVVEGFVSMAINQVAGSTLGQKTATLLLLVVNQKLRNQGIAKHLVASALKILQNNNVRLVTVGTDLYNNAALHVYESLGFRIQMAWHIYRYYAHWKTVQSKMEEEVDIIQVRFLELFKKEFDRPVSLLKDPKLKTATLRNLLFENLYRNLVKGNVFGLMWKKHQQPEAVILYQHDQIALATLGLERGIYRVLDNWGSPQLQVKLFQDLIARLRDLKLLEYWVRADNRVSIRSAEDAGLKLSYSGISLHLYF